MRFPRRHGPRSSLPPQYPTTRSKFRTAIPLPALLSAIGLLLIAAPSFCAPITYAVDLEGTNSLVYGLSGSVVGTITTDGAQGQIGHADILDYSIRVTLGSESATLTPVGGEVDVDSFPLIANPTGLFESSSPAGYTVFGIVALPRLSGNYFELDSPYFEPAQFSIRVDGVLDFFRIPASPNYEALLATAEPASIVGGVPEPGGVALLLIGGMALGASMQRKGRSGPPKGNHLPVQACAR